VIDRSKLNTILQQTTVALVGIPPQPQTHFDIHVYETVASTNAILWDWLEQGAPEGTVAIAQQQQSGKGQRGRPWQSVPGGLYLSLGLTPDLDPTAANGLTLCCAWGIAAALRGQDIPVGVKWINDLILERHKLGGILTETRIQQGRIRRAVVGMGLNWANAVPETGIALRSWLEQRPGQSGADCVDSLEKLAAIALQGAMGGYHFWKSAGTTGLLPHYEALLVNRGQVISLDNQPATVLGIDAQGFLRVQDMASGAVRYLEPGQVHLGYPTP